MADLSSVLHDAAGEVAEVDAVPAVRARAAQRRRRRLLAGAAAVLAVAGVAAAVLVDRDPERVDIVDVPAPASTGMVLLFDDGYDGVVALDLDRGVVGRRVVEGQRAGDEGRPLLKDGALVVGWGPPSIAPLDGSPSIELAEAYVYLPGGADDEVWARTEAGEVLRYGLDGTLQVRYGAPGGWPVLVTPRGTVVLERGNFLDVWVDGAVTSTVALPSEGVTALATSATRLAWCDRATCSRLHLRDLATGADTDVMTRPMVAAAFAPDGSTLAVAHDEGVALVEVATAEVTEVPLDGLEVHALAWSPAGDRLVAAAFDPDGTEPPATVVVVDPTTGEAERTPIRGGGDLGILALFAVVDRADASSFFPPDDQLGAPEDCPPPAIQPSGRSPEPCGFRLDQPAGGDPQLRFDGYVVEGAAGGPSLCADLVLPGIPTFPECAGTVPVAGWSWDLVEGERTDGTGTWAYVAVVGTWDGTTFTVNGTTRPRTSPLQPPQPTEALCGGLDAGLGAGQEEAAYAAAGALPDYLWAYESENGFMNVIVTEDVARAEAAIAAVWDGSLCVVLEDRPSRAELAEIEAALVDEAPPELGAIWRSWVLLEAELLVTVVTPEARAYVDGRFGPGVVRLEGVLRPVDE